jgi:hypothetical protein
MFTFAQGRYSDKKPGSLPPHQEPGTGARPCPRGPGFLVAPGAIELAQAHVLDAGPAHCEPNHSANRAASTWSGAVSAPSPATTRVPYRRSFVTAMAWSTVS